MHQDTVEVVSIVVIVLVRSLDLFLNGAKLALNIVSALYHHLLQLVDHLLSLPTLLSLRVNAFPDAGQVREWVVAPLAGSGCQIWRAAKRDILPCRDALHEIGGLLDTFNYFVLVHLFEDFAELGSLVLQLGGGPLDCSDAANVILQHLVDVDTFVELELLAVLYDFLLLLIISHSIERKEQHIRRVLYPELIPADHFFR